MIQEPIPQEALDELLQREKDDFKDRLCGDCAVSQGQAHAIGCDVARCLGCGRQCLGCECEGETTFGDIWDGVWPGVIAAYEQKALTIWRGEICFDLNAVSREAMIAERLKIRDHYSKIPN